jgi:hypothetical protein
MSAATAWRDALVRRPGLLVFLGYALVATVWSWPMAQLAPDVVVTRHFDLYPTTWLLERAPRTLPGLWHQESAWPVGESLARVDSYVILLLATLLRPVLSGLQVASLVGWLGPAVTAWAAERVAHRTFEVPRPASLLAGLAFGFAGVAATAVLEGHVYHLLDPWLPLLLGAVWSDPPRGNREAFRGGLWAGLWFALALWTTAYFGVLAAGVLAAAALRHAPTKPGVWARHAGVLAVALPAGLLYLWLFRQGGTWGGQGDDPVMHWRIGVVTLASFAGWSDALDKHAHSIGAPAGFVTLALLGMAPLVLSRQRGWKLLAGVAVLALGLGFGRELRVFLEPRGTWWPAALLADLPGAQWFRFPARFTWLFGLCGGVVAARVLAGLAGRDARLVWATLALALGDLVVGQGTALRLERRRVEIPEVYAQAPEGRAVLDVFAPPREGATVENEMWVRAMSCFYQAWHARPIFEVCIGTDVDSPRERVADWLVRAAVAPEADAARIRGRLEALDVGAVALHLDSFPGGATRLSGAFTAIWGQPAESRVGERHTQLWVVPPAPGARPREEWARMLEEDAPTPLSPEALR